MRVEQLLWKDPDSQPPPRDTAGAASVQLVLALGSSPWLEDGAFHARLRDRYPRAHIVSASTAGEIFGTQVLDGAVVTTGVAFEETAVEAARVSVRELACSAAAGRALGERLTRPDLRHVFVLSEGVAINGSDLAKGMRESLPDGVAVTGGLSGDGARFRRTLVGLDAVPEPGNVVGIGFYGSRLRVSYGSLGGWDPFGPERVVTRARGNVVYELDGQPALTLYRRYLGEHAAGLPATGLLFPLTVRRDGDEVPLVRTLLAIDDEAGSVTFAGDVPEGSLARLMRANFDRLVDGAVGAARGCMSDGESPELALLVSCVGRKLLLQQRIEEEVEAVRDVLGERPVLAGFYSYGEICPNLSSVKCELHNQTMTVTTLSE